jgi:hypothetical protein
MPTSNDKRHPAAAASFLQNRQQARQLTSTRRSGRSQVLVAMTEDAAWRNFIKKAYLKHR